MSYLLHGQNPVAIDERITQLRAQLDPSGLGTTTIDVQASSLQEIAATCQAMPFFGGSRVVVLHQPIAKPKRGDATADDDAGEESGRVSWTDLSVALKSVPPSTEVIMRHDGSLTATHYVMKAVKALGWKLESFPMPRGQDLLQWLGQRVAERGGSVDQHAPVTLLDRLFPQSWNVEPRYANSTPDLRLLATEIDKLVVAADGGTITQSLVEDLVIDREGYAAFKLNDATFGGNLAGSLTELSDILDAGEHPEMIMAQTAGQAVAITASLAVGDFGAKEVARVSGFSEGRLSTLQRNGASVPLSGNQRAAESIRSTGLTLRTTADSQMAPAFVTQLVAEIAEAVRLSKSDRRTG